jgi:hypothetical protein
LRLPRRSHIKKKLKNKGLGALFSALLLGISRPWVQTPVLPKKPKPQTKQQT